MSCYTPDDALIEQIYLIFVMYGKILNLPSLIPSLENQVVIHQSDNLFQYRTLYTIC